jgi:hypothetical protein
MVISLDWRLFRHDVRLYLDIGMSADRLLVKPIDSFIVITLLS